MSKIKNHFHDEIERKSLTPEQIRELAYEMEIEEKNAYYMAHPEEIHVNN
jgi:hypothetical protein